MGRRRRDRPLGDVAGLRRPAAARGAVADRWSPGSTSHRASAATQRHPVRARHERDAATPRAVPVGHRLSLGRMVRTRRRSRTTTSPNFATATSASSPPRYFAPLRRARWRPIARHARPRRRRRPATRSSRPNVARRVAHGVPRRRRLRALRHARPTVVRALAFDLVPDRPCARRRPTGSSRWSATHGHAPRHRLPRDAVPAAGARRHRSPRRRLRAAVPGHAAVVAGDDRPRRDHDLGALGGRRRRRRRPRARSTTTAKARSSRSSTEYVAGIQLLDDGPAYRRFRVAPLPGGGLTWASAMHESPYGRIESSWSTGRDWHHVHRAGAAEHRSRGRTALRPRPKWPDPDLPRST